MIDRALALLAPGSIAFNKPSVINLGEAQQVQLLLSPSESVEALQSQMTAAGEREGHTILVSNRMQATLSGQCFSITAITPEEQAVARTLVTEWRWEVSPTCEGDHLLHLALTALFDVDGRPEPRTLRTFDAAIHVHVPLGRRFSDFARSHFEWLWAVLCAPLVAWGWRAWRHRGRGAPAPTPSRLSRRDLASERPHRP